jgi:hypothetical protein
MDECRTNNENVQLKAKAEQYQNPEVKKRSEENTDIKVENRHNSIHSYGSKCLQR